MEENVLQTKTDLIVTALKSLVQCCIQNQKDAKIEEKDFSVPILEEFCTVKLFCGRRSGLTTAAFKSYQIFKNALFVSMYSVQADNHKNQKQQLGFDSNIECCTIREMEKLHGIFFDGIFIDGASYLPDDYLNFIYRNSLRLMQKDTPFCIVLMG